MENYDETTFEPVETQEADTTEEAIVTPVVPEKDEPKIELEVEPKEGETVPETIEEPKVTPAKDSTKDNDAVRYEYQQSRADKLEREMAELRSKLEPPPKEDAPPVDPGENADPLDAIKYSREMSNYTLKQIQKMNEKATQTETQKQEADKQLAFRNYSIAKLTEVNKSPQKSTQIVNFFANSEHLANPKVYDVMYDAAQAFLKGKAPAGIPSKAPPPPTGGESVTGEKTIDEAFSDELRQQKSYRL